MLDLESMGETISIPFEFVTKLVQKMVQVFEKNQVPGKLICKVSILYFDKILLPSETTQLSLSVNKMTMAPSKNFILIKLILE